MEDKFVFLSIMESEVHTLLFNLLEMWCCLTLQTLTKNALLAYLPEGKMAPSAGTHLNVALPIYQSANTKGMTESLLHGDIYHSNNKLVQQNYSNLRKRFFELKDSPEPTMREYYMRTMRHARIKKSNTQRA
jgi:hypothetical protein